MDNPTSGRRPEYTVREIDGKFYAVYMSPGRTSHHTVPPQEMFQRVESLTAEPKSKTWYGTTIAADNHYRKPWG